ncbi:MAG: hypothetical protein ACJ8J0_09895 [Longimicrobiaceae bacterium]
MAKDFDELLAEMSPERRARIERRAEEILSSPLYRVRKALQFAHEQEPLVRRQRPPHE